MREAESESKWERRRGNELDLFINRPLTSILSATINWHFAYYCAPKYADLCKCMLHYRSILRISVQYRTWCSRNADRILHHYRGGLMAKHATFQHLHWFSTQKRFDNKFINCLNFRWKSQHMFCSPQMHINNRGADALFVHQFVCFDLCRATLMCSAEHGT